MGGWNGMLGGAQDSNADPSCNNHAQWLCPPACALALALGSPECTAGQYVGSSCAFRRVFPGLLWGGGSGLDGGPAAGHLGEPEF